jgi:arsenite methyltransferase
VFPICGNSWMMLKDTRFVRHFDFIGSFDSHHGIFEGCGGESPFEGETNDEACC